MSIMSEGLFSQNATRCRATSLLIGFLAPLAFYLLFNSHCYDGDGLRNLPWNWGDFTMGGNNHFLTSFWYWSWWQWVHGCSGPSFEEKMHWLAVLNAILGALSVCLVMDLVFLQTRKHGSALLTGLLLAISAAFFYHSTQTTEPMIGLFWFLLSWRLLVSKQCSNTAVTVLSAVCLAVSVASYQSFVLGGLGLAILSWSNAKKGVTWMFTVTVVGVFLFAGAAYGRGAENAHAVLQQIFERPGAELSGVWGGWRLDRLPGIPMGMAQAICPWLPQPWLGWRTSGPTLSSAQLAKFFLIVFATFGAMAYVTLRLLLQKPLQRSAVAVIAIFLGGMIAPYYFDTCYYKMWLLPLAAFSVMVGCLFSIRPFVRRVAVGMCLVIFVWNWFAVYEKNHRRDNPQARAVAKLEQSLRPDDLLVCDGWDHSGAFRAKNPRQPGLMLLDFDGKNLTRLTRTFYKTWNNGGRVFFFGVLDIERHQWTLSIGKWGGWDYDMFADFRTQSRLVFRGSDYGFEGQLFELLPP